jgi:4-hydroxy-2-oxoheptanedioate aldolase
MKARFNMGNFQSLFSRKQKLIGTLLHIPSPEIAEIIGLCGYDFLMIDMEHGNFGIEGLLHLLRAADSLSLFTMVRVPENNPVHICKVLDMGTKAVMVPQISSAKEGQEALRAAKYAPLGSRGAFPYGRSSLYGQTEKQQYFQEQNKMSSVILMVEGMKSLEIMEEILSLKEMDAIFIGPVDLSNSLGLPGKLDHPRVLEAVANVCQKAHFRDVKVGVFADSEIIADLYMKAGVDFIIYSVDAKIIYSAFKEVRTSLERIIG